MLRFAATATELVVFGNEPLRFYVNAFVDGYASQATRRDYRDDLRFWIESCNDICHVDPRPVKRAHVELSAGSIDGRGLPASIKRRLRTSTGTISRGRDLGLMLFLRGGFKRSSQHLDSEELRWAQEDVVGGLIALAVPRCVRPDARRWDGVSIGSGFGWRDRAGFGRCGRSLEVVAGLAWTSPTTSSSVQKDPNQDRGPNRICRRSPT